MKNKTIRRTIDAIRAKRRQRWRSFGSVINLGGSLRRRQVRDVSVYDALCCDAFAIGQDLATAAERVTAGLPSSAIPCRKAENSTR